MTDPIVYQFQATGADKVISSIKSINAENELMARFLRELQQAFGLSEKAAQGYAKSLGITGSTLKSYQQAQAEAAKSAGVLANEQAKTTKAIQGTDEAAKALAKQFVASAGARATTFLKDTATDALDAARRFNGLNAALLTVSGSQDKASENFKFIRSEVNRLGLDLEKATSGFNKLVASTKDVELSKEIFTGINEAASALQLSADDTNGVIIALTQIASKGVVSMEELRQQLGERLPGAFQLAAKSMNLTEAEFTKLVSTGEVKAIPFLKKFAPALKDAFGEGAARNANSLNAQFNRLNTALFELAATVGNVIAPAFKLVADGVISLSAFFKGLPEPIQQTIIVLTGLAVGLVAVAGAIAAFSLASTALIPVMGTLTASTLALSASMYQLSIATVAANGLSALGASLAKFAVLAVTGAVALAPLLLALGAVAAAAAGMKAVIRTINFDKNIDNFQELQRGSQALGDTLATLGIKTRDQIKVFKDLADSGKGASKEQVAAANALIAANEDAIASANARIAALQSQLGQEEILDNQIKAQIAGETKLRDATKAKNDEFKQTVASVKVAISGLAQLTDAYDRTIAQIEAASAQRQASIFERVKDEEEANKQILADDIETNKQRLEETEKLIAKLGIASQALSKSKDSKDVAERQKIEDSITKLISQASKQRVDIAKGEADQRKAVEAKLLEDLDAANKKALDAINTSVQFRIDAAKRESVGNIKAKEEEAVVIARIEREAADQRLALVIAEQAKLQALKGNISGNEFRARELALAQEQSAAILAIAQNETALLAAEQEKRLAEITRVAEVAKEQLGAVKIKLEFEVSGLEAQKTLLEAQGALQESLSASRIAAAQQELADITTAGNLRNQLNALDAGAITQRAELTKQLAALNQSASTTEIAAITQRQAKEAALAALQKQSLLERQALELRLFDIKAQQQQISLQILNTEKQIAVIEAQSAASTLAASGANAQQLAIAQQKVSLAQQALTLTQQSASVAATANASARQALVTDQARAISEQAKTAQNLAQVTALERAKVADAAIATSSKQVADNTAKSAENTAKAAQDAGVLADNWEKAAERSAEAANNAIKAITGSLDNAELGVAGISNSGSGFSGISIKTIDRNKLLKEQLELQLKLATTEEEKGVIEDRLSKLQQDNTKKELQLLEEKIRRNEQLLEYARLLEIAARSPSGTGSAINQIFDIEESVARNARFRASVQGLFTGGNISAGQPAIVGEDPNTGSILPSSELFVPNVSGYVMAASKFQALLSQGVPSKGIVASSGSRSPDYLKTISGDIKSMNQKIGQLQPTIEQVNINSEGAAPDDMVYKLLSAQIKARR